MWGEAGRGSGQREARQGWRSSPTANESRCPKIDPGLSHVFCEGYTVEERPGKDGACFPELSVLPYLTLTLAVTGS